MNFLVHISCAVALAQCPLPGGQPMTAQWTANSRQECQAKINGFILQLNYDPKKFHIDCKRQ